MSTNPILMPMLAMVALTFAVWTRLLRVRVREMRTRRIHPQSVATSRERAELLDDTAAADNFINLSELPVLFHVLCLVLLFTHNETALFVSGAWLYVILRTGHSLIQCTYNRVLHRFSVYLASTAVLIALWVGLAARLLG